MKRFIQIMVVGLMFIAGQAWGATETFYVCEGGDGSAPEAGVCATAFEETDVADLANWDTDAEDDGLIGADDELLFLDDGGNFDEQIYIRRSGLSGQNIVVKPAEGENVVLSPGSGTIAINGGQNYLTISGFTISTCDDGIRLTVTQYKDADGCIIENNTITNATGMGIVVQQAAGVETPLVTTGLIIRNNTVTTTGEHGIAVMGEFDGPLLQNNTVSYAGQTANTWGIYAGTRSSIYNGAWVGPASNVYNQTMATIGLTGETAKYVIAYDMGTPYELTEGTHGSLANLEWSEDSGSIYVRLDSYDPNDADMIIVTTLNTGAIFDGNDASYTNNNSGTWDGVGIGTDLGARAAEFYSNHTHHNEGRGIETNLGGGNTIKLNVSNDNGIAGISINKNNTTASAIYNNTCADNGSNQIQIYNSSTYLTLTNNILYGGDRGIYEVSSTSTESYNNPYSNSVAAGATVNAVTVDPKLNSNYVPMNKDVSNGGTLGSWLDSDCGLTRYGTGPPIGAKEGIESDFIPRIGPPFRPIIGWDYVVAGEDYDGLWAVYTDTWTNYTSTWE